MQHHHKKRVGRAVVVTAGGIAEATVSQKIRAFYVSGTSIGGGDPTHTTPWPTIDDAMAAARADILALNAWWAASHPGEMYLDPDADVIVDTVHLNGGTSIRCGVLPNALDNPPPPPPGAVLLAWTDGSDWIAF